MAWVETMGNLRSSVEANMGRARRWVSIALSALVAACISVAVPGLGQAAQEALDWNVSGSVDAGGIYSFGERGSSKFNEYRDMDNGFVGELSLRGEKKDQPYFFELNAKNPARDDQLYDGAFGRYGSFRLDLGWDRTPHVLSNTAQTIYQESGSNFTLPSTLRPTITATFNAIPANVAATPISAANQALINNIRDTINGLARPVNLGFNTDVGEIILKLTPTDALRFDLGYSNIHREGHRPLGTVIGSPGGSATELAIPIDNFTNEVKFGAEYARPDYALQFNYTGSFFKNQFDSYSWDNTLSTTDTAAASSRGQVSAAPDNMAHTLSFTGSAALPLRSRLSGGFSYSMLRQDQTFLPNIPNTIVAGGNTNSDTNGQTSPNAQANLVNGNILLTSRPINNVTATARYRYFEYQNDTPEHVFAAVFQEGVGPSVPRSTLEERYTKQNAGLDLGWHPISMLNLKAGYEYEHWNRGDREAQSTDENIGKFAVDMTPLDWLLGRVSYTHGDRYVNNYQNVPGQLPQLVKFDESDRRRDRVDLLLQFSPWETVTPSVNFGYARDDYYNSSYGLKSDDYYSAGVSLGWTPLRWLQFSADYAYEYYKYDQQSRYATARGNATDVPGNDWESSSKDEFHTVGVDAVVNLIPKKFDVTLGYAVSLGYTTIRAHNLTVPPTTPSSSLPGITPNNATAFDWDKVFNVLQTFKIVGRYRVTERLSLRGGFAYERYTEKDFARDPMAPFMGTVDTANSGIQSVFLGATVPNYEAYIFSGFVRYDF